MGAGHRHAGDAPLGFLELRTPLTSIVSFSELMRAETGALTADGAQFSGPNHRQSGPAR